MGIFHTAIEIRKLKERISQEQVKLQDYLNQLEAYRECPYESPMTCDAIAAAAYQEGLVAELEHNLYILQDMNRGKYQFEVSWLGIQTKHKDYEEWSAGVDSQEDSREDS